MLDNDKQIKSEQLNQVAGGYGYHSPFYIDPYECLNCGRCIDVCAPEAIDNSDWAPRITSRCEGCGDCCGVCPSGAIHES